MFRSSLKYVVIGLAVAVALTMTAQKADAFGHCWGCGYTAYAPYYTVSYSPCYSSCYTPCYSSCYSSCYTPYYSSCYTGCGTACLGVRPGPIRRALFGPYRWYYSGACGVGCTVGGCGTSCCQDGCTTSCCGETSCCGGDTATSTTTMSPVTPTPAVPENNGPTPAPPAPPTVPDAGPMPIEEPSIPAMPEATGIPTPDNTGLLQVWVPYDAKVFVNGLATRSKGSRRQYVSHGLKPGFTYTYKIRAEVVRNDAEGKPKIYFDEQTVTLVAGERTSVAFGFNIDTNQQVASY